MRKSKTVRLVLLGGTSLALGACDDTPPSDAKFFANLQECTAHYSEDKCQTMIKKADEEHVANAPKYSRKEECEAEFGIGHCETRGEGSGSFFMPMMMGYMLGNMMGGGWYGPVYRGRDNAAFTTTAGGSTYNVGSFNGSGRGAAFSSSGAITQVARGGFGASSRSYSSSSGS